jgi:hypothetical protein
MPEPRRLSGFYTILVDPQGTDLGSMTLTLYAVPGRPERVDRDRRAAGQPLRRPSAGAERDAHVQRHGCPARELALSNVTIGNTSCCGARISVLKPDGTNVVPPILVGTFGATITATPLLTGAYSIVVDPQGAYTGGITLTMSPA